MYRMLDEYILEKVIDKALQKGGDFAEVYVEEKRVNNVFCEDDKIEKINSGREKGAGIRVIKDGNTAYVFTNDLSEKGLLKAADVATHAADDNKTKKNQELVFNLKKAHFELQFLKLPENITFTQKIEKVLSANRVAREFSSEIKQVTVAVGDIQKRIQIANSNGELVEDELARVRMIVNAIASREEIIQTGYEVAGGVCGWEIIDLYPPEELARQAAKRAVSMLSARSAPVGRMPVIMSSEAGGTMVHEACGHGLEADLVQKGLSVYKGKIGEKVASELVTVIDDGTIAGKNGSSRFDDEGNHTEKTVLIEKGILKSYLYDRLTAEKDGRKSTGNGRRESYQHKPIPRMTNTYIASGKDEAEKIINDTSRGLYVRKMGGGQVNTTNGDFVFDVQEGYIIENGEVKYPVRGATLTGNGPRALADIDCVGNDLGFAIGVCGKDGQGVAVADAQPTIRIKELTVGGTFAD